jgi:hypothetical protein
MTRPQRRTMTRRTALTLGLGLFATAAVPGCSPGSSAPQPGTTPPRLNLMRDRARAARATGPGRHAIAPSPQPTSPR